MWSVLPLRWEILGTWYTWEVLFTGGGLPSRLPLTFRIAHLLLRTPGSVCLVKSNFLWKSHFLTVFINNLQQNLYRYFGVLFKRTQLIGLGLPRKKLQIFVNRSGIESSRAAFSSFYLVDCLSQQRCFDDSPSILATLDVFCCPSFFSMPVIFFEMIFHHKDPLDVARNHNINTFLILNVQSTAR